MKKILGVALLGSLSLVAAGCSGGGETSRNATTTNSSASATTTTTSASPGGHVDAPGATPHGHDGGTAPAAGTESHGGGGAANSDAPANVRAVFPEAQSITTQHKDISASQIATIEKETGTKITDKDHHSYLAFSTAGGARKQIGAATVVKAGGKEIVVIYESRNGVPYIREVRGEGMPQAFLDGFKGKGHDDKFQVGGDLKSGGADDATAKGVAAAVRQDAVIMQTLYGGKHSH